jgi:carboxyl-terminal processing protease
LVVRYLEQYHYTGRGFDDELSERSLENYLDALDYSHLIFLQADVDAFRAKYADRLDDLNDDPMELVAASFEIYELYRQRMRSRLEYVHRLLDGEIDLSNEEIWHPKRNKRPWPESEEEASELWRLRIEEQVLQGDLRERERSEQIEMLRERYDRLLKDLDDTNELDALEVFLGSVTMAFDPHSYWFSPASEDNFRIEMEKSLEGIGARLRMRGEYTVVEGLIPGGPADLVQDVRLKKGDRIIGVAQGVRGEFVDVVDRRIDDVVALIRGKQGTIVRLMVIPVDATDESVHTVVQIRRDKVILEENRAELTVHEVEREGSKPLRVAHIDVPSFYMESEEKAQGLEYQSTTLDVQRLLGEMSDVDGLILDLRNNGGGALDEALSLTGLFIPEGPVVQVRDGDGTMEVLGDPVPGVAYDGPLVVLIGSQSASASEILAGAIQDYGRGLLVGSEQTHGKGTVQSMIDLNEPFMRFPLLSGGKRGGAIKLTTAMFYRINGESTQGRGVAPDVLLPSPWDGYEMYERELDYALPWESSSESPFVPWDGVMMNAKPLQAKSDARVAANDTFSWWKTDLAERKRLEDEPVSLNLKARKAEMEERKLKMKASGQDPDALMAPDALEEATEDDAPSEESEAATVDDPVLAEALMVSRDFILMQSTGPKNKKKKD